MNESGSFEMNELSLGKGKASHKLAYVKDADLQVHVPTIKDTNHLEDTHTFKNIMMGYLDDVNTLQHDADAQIQRLIAGETEDLHQVMLAMDEAETSFEMMMEIRNKLVQAYQELIKMQV
jgi:flagellar hook-basal body complex protein FliE